MTMEAVREGRRERRTRETRRKILLAARDLFAERGLDAVTVDEIAERADVARATVFNYFSTKESLCSQLGELQVELLLEAEAEGRIHGPSAGEKIAQALREMADFMSPNPEISRQLLPRALASMQPGELPEHKRFIFNRFQTWVEEGQQSGELRTDVPPCELAGFIMGLQFQAVLAWAYGFAQGSLAEVQECVLKLGLEGIRIRKDFQ